MRATLAAVALLAGVSLAHRTIPGATCSQKAQEEVQHSFAAAIDLCKDGCSPACKEELASTLHVSANFRKCVGTCWLPFLLRVP
jgi:hypothetical protein